MSTAALRAITGAISTARSLRPPERILPAALCSKRTPLSRFSAVSFIVVAERISSAEIVAGAKAIPVAFVLRHPR